ncbi:MAG: hypothetical protein ACYDCC_15430 [Actinomycetota bacterium]
MPRRRLIFPIATACLCAFSTAVVFAGVRLSANATRSRQVAADGLHSAFQQANPFASTQPQGPAVYPDTGPPQALVGEPGPIPSVFAQAKQIDGIPASFHWALLIGINLYYGGTRNNIGSFQDAQTLHDYLLSLGWLPDHVLLIGNHAATHNGILAGLAWLQSHTDERSIAIFNYGGHEDPFYVGGERHIFMQPSDNNYIEDTVVAAELGKVRASRMWINMAVCRADGFNKPGMVKDGRVVTFSSPASELSYEDPDVHHSVFGYNLIVNGIIHDQANRKGPASVEMAFRYSLPFVWKRTLDLQHPVMVDRYPGGNFYLSL